MGGDGKKQPPLHRRYLQAPAAEGFATGKISLTMMMSPPVGRRYDGRHTAMDRGRTCLSLISRDDDGIVVAR
jgi:hypothetical protein